MSKEDDINKLINSSALKSQSNMYKSSTGIKKREKCLLNESFILKTNNILKYSKKGKYIIPIII